VSGYFASRRIRTMSRRVKTSFPNPHLFGSPGSGSAFIWLSWIRIRIYLALMDPDPHLFGSPGSGSAFIWLSSIRIRIYLALIDPDPHLFGSPGSGYAFISLSLIRSRIYLAFLDPDLDAIKLTKMCAFQFYIGFHP
jgi:hypothetical protein